MGSGLITKTREHERIYEFIRVSLFVFWAFRDHFRRRPRFSLKGTGSSYRFLAEVEPLAVECSWHVRSLISMRSEVIPLGL